MGKNEKINPIVNGQDILSIGKSKSKNSTEIKDEDEDICILPTPFKDSENLPALQKASGDIPREKENEKLEHKANVSDPRQERKANDNDPRQSKVTEDTEILNAKESGNLFKSF